MKAAVVFSVLSLMAAVLNTSGCALYDTYLTWHNGEPIGERLNVGSAAECEAGCRETRGCSGWTLNTRNGWCAFKSEEQIKPEIKTGFESGILDSSSQFCSGGAQTSICPLCQAVFVGIDLNVATGSTGQSTR